MFVAIAKPNSCWSEPIIGLTRESVINGILEIYKSPDVVIINHNDLTLRWDDDEVADEEWFIGEYLIARREKFDEFVRNKMQALRGA